MIFNKSYKDVDKIILLTILTPVEKLVIIGLLRQGYSARDIAAITGTSPRAVYYALDDLIERKIIENNAGIYSLKHNYMRILCNMCNIRKRNARARTRKSLQSVDTVSPPHDSAELDKKIP